MAREHWSPLQMQRVVSEGTPDRTTVTAVFESRFYRTVGDRDVPFTGGLYAHIPDKELVEMLSMMMAEHVRRVAGRG